MLWRVFLALVTFATLSACAPSPAPRATETPAVAAVTDAGARGFADVEPPLLAVPQDVACTYEADQLSLDLALDGESRTFGNLLSASGTLTIPKGPASRGAFLEHAHEGLHVRGWVHGGEITFYPTRAVLFGGWLAPRGGTSLRWVSASDRELELELAEPLQDGRLTTVTFRETPRAKAPCKDLSFEPREDGLDTVALVSKGQKGTSQHVRPGEPIPIAALPGGSPMADIQFAYADTAEVLVVDRRGSDALVVIDSWGPATLYGWISDSFFAPSPGRLVSGQHARAPTVRFGKAVQRDTKRVTCDATVRILAEVAGRRAWIGEIEPGTPFIVLVDERSDRFANVDFVTNLHPHDGARLSVERAALTTCGVVTPR